MKARQLVFGAALVIVTAAVTTQVVSQNANQNEPPAMSPEEAAMMEKWAAFMTPGENHERLNFKVGKWEGVVKHWMDPAAPPEEAPATAEYSWIMDGRYLQNRVNGDFGGMPFNGQAWEGYDNIKKKFFWVWIDNMGTGIMVGEGTYDEATKSFKHTFEQPDPMTGKYVKGRSVERVIDKDHFVSEMYGPGPDGKEFKMMEITYTRAK
jgi:hypothetical protein